MLRSYVSRGVEVWRENIIVFSIELLPLYNFKYPLQYLTFIAFSTHLVLLSLTTLQIARLIKQKKIFLYRYSQP